MVSTWQDGNTSPVFNTVLASLAAVMSEGEISWQLLMELD